MTKICKTPSCDEEAKCGGLCAACYQYAYYWNRQGVARSMKHRDKLELRTERLDAMVPSNVHRLAPVHRIAAARHRRRA